MSHSPLSTRAALLFALRRKAGYGMELIERVNQITHGRIELLQPAVYPALKKLETEGLASSKEKPNDHGARPKRIYKLTAEGRRYVAREKKALEKLIGK